MRFAFLTGTAFILLVSCGPTIQAQCGAAHQGDSAAAARCIQIAETRILTSPGSAFQKSRRGGPG